MKSQTVTVFFTITESESGYFECFKKLMNGTHSTQMELNGVPISNKNPKMVLNLFFSSLISIGKQYIKMYLKM